MPSRLKVFRAHLDDVENLSYGRGAKKQRGTGSRFTCHRLNRDERRAYEASKKDGYLTLSKSGYRKERKGSPLWNTHRQRCDALAELCVVHEKRSSKDRVVLDFSTLRVPNDQTIAAFCVETLFSSEAISLENTIHGPIQWETVQTKPIWAVEQRIIAFECDDRELIKSIVAKALEVGRSVEFANLVSKAEKEEVRIESSSSTMTSTNDDEPRTDGIDTNDDETDCIDWDDI